MFNSLHNFGNNKKSISKVEHKELKKNSYACMKVVKLQNENSIYKPLLKYANILEIKSGYELELLQKLKIIKVID